MNFAPFTIENLAATRVAWVEDAANGGGFVPDVEQQLDWAEKHITLTDNEVAYGVFTDNSPVATGICELCITRPSARAKWVKFMRLRLRPLVDEQLFDHKKEGVTAAVEAYIACVIAICRLGKPRRALI
jgi:hypothetical protein